MISAARFFGGQQDVSFSGTKAVPPWGGVLVAATATAGGSFLGPQTKAATWFHWREGGPFWWVWNKGATTFTFVDAEGEGVSEALTQDQGLIVGITRVPAGGNAKWVVMRMKKIGGN